MAQGNAWLKRGWEDIKTYGRQGLRELRNAFYADSNIARDVDPGMYGMPLQREVYEARHANAAQPTAEPIETRASSIERLVRDAEKQWEAEAQVPARARESLEVDRD